MSFLHPAFLWALTALAIPVLIHLFQLRRFKRIDFPNVRFLAEISQQTRARKKVQHWLVLLARMLALACLVLAFAQPYLPSKSGAVQAGQRAVSLFLDDSFSMDGRNAQGRLLDQARKGAQDAVMAYSATDRFQVLTGQFGGKEQILLGRDEALDASAQAEVGPYSRLLSKVLLRQREALASSEARTKRAILFTDLQRSITDVEAWTNDTLVPTVIVPLTASTPNNLSIDSAWFGSPVRRAGQDEELHVRIRNYGDQDLVNVPLRLDVDGRQRAVASFSVGGGAVVDTTLRFLGDGPGNHWGVVSVNDQPVVFDDRLYIAYQVTDRLRVLLVSGGDATGDRAVTSVFAGDSTHTFTTQPYRSLDLAGLAAQALVVLNALPDVPGGLSLRSPTSSPMAAAWSCSRRAKAMPAATPNSSGPWVRLLPPVSIQAPCAWTASIWKSPFTAPFFRPCRATWNCPWHANGGTSVRHPAAMCCCVCRMVAPTSPAPCGAKAACTSARRPWPKAPATSPATRSSPRRCCAWPN
ncbi:MAG: BatA domain-containing protein [Flavobacteriales bacterium]|nr:BatA domain-containing protein [Flavobacteriales bacterium]